MAVELFQIGIQFKSFFYYGTPMSVNFCFIFMLLDLKQRGFMVTKILKRITDFCSLKAPEGTTRSNRKAGFTIIELMVVIIIMNLLAGVAVPKVTDLIEKTRQKIDVLKLYYLRDSLNRALYEDQVTNIDTKDQAGGNCGNNNANNLTTWLTQPEGVTLFIIERNTTMDVNYQGKYGSSTGIKGINVMCGLTFTEGFWNNALKDAGFGAVADIVADRAAGDKFNYNSTTYTTVKPSNHQWKRTYPTDPIFISSFMNRGYYSSGQSTLAMKIRWTGGNPDNHTLEVFLADNSGTDQNAVRSRQGVCFSTLGDKGCK